MKTLSPLRLLLCLLVGALFGGIVGGWLAMAIGLVLLPLVVIGLQGLRRQLSH